MFAPRRYFLDITLAGMAGAPFAELKRLGIVAEERMLRAAQGINTHRRAIFYLGLLCAAIGRCRAAGTPLTAMAGRLLVLCPGQGAQHPAMFDMARGDPAAPLLLDACFTDPVLAPLLEGVVDGASLFANRVAQPAIVADTLAMWEALRETVPARHCRGCCRRATAASPAVPLPNSAPWTGYALD